MRACAVAVSNSPAFSPSMAAPPPALPKKRTRSRVKRREKVPPEDDGVATVLDAALDIEDFSADAIVEARSSLLRWYDANKRSMPWRTAASCSEGDREDRAYAVWVSEVMLQQTQVATVVGYYERWMKRWPTVQHLASASQEEVNEMWAGLGYYRRARFLLEGAKSIVEAGKFPKSAEELRKVRGIGDYTSGAIASIAFNEVVPVVDGNVIRVIARLMAISANPRESATMKSIWKLAGQLVDPSRPGDFNQALMELGATLCNRTNPGCSSCPLSDHCHAFALSGKLKSVQVTDYPIKVTKAKQRNDFAAVCILEIVEDLNLRLLKANSYQKAFLLVKRPDEGLLAGLWEFPLVLLDGEEETDLATRRKEMDTYLTKAFGLNLGGNCTALSREDVGGPSTLESKEQQSLTWKIIDGDSIKMMGLTSGVKKVYEMTENFKCKRLLPLQW